MRVLAIDTSGPACSLALFEDGALLAQRHEVIGRGHAEHIIPWIAELPGGGFADAILVGCGPGSFTGVRVGIAAARALALGWGSPISGMNSLALIAAAAQSETSVLVAIEGGHGEIFVQRFNCANDMNPGSLESLCPKDAANAYDIPVIVGSAAQKVVIERGFGTALTFNPDASFAFSLPLALRSLPACPVYGRAPDAKPALR